jgi:mono/diheme cytochrome c family protein
VDKKPGNLEPNPNPNIPLDANGKAYYSVPIDNPFVLTDNGGTWDGSGYFAGRDANLTTRDPNFDYSTIRTEFWAYGMRNPWRFSFDSATGTLWLADVGQNTYEEVDLMQKGGNYGWPFFEGTYNTQTDANISGGYVSAGTVYPTPVPPANPSPFLNPIYEYSHGSGPLQGDAVIGGLVYHGANLPALDGMYIFGDYSGGNIWSLCYNGTGTNVQVLANSPGLAGFGLDPSNGDVLVANNGNGQVQRLSLSVSNGTFPTTLSATGLFANLTNLSPAPGVVPYSVNLPSWNDGAQTSYWFAIPDGVSQMTWGQDTPWTFPAGMIWVQNLDLETTPGDPTTLKHIETRVLVSNTTGVYGVNYQWNAAQTDATIVPAAGANLSLNLTVNDTTQTQIWHFPGEADCLSCHNANAGYALSFNTRQLNRVQNLNGNVGNQIDLLSQFGYFANSPPASGTLPAYPALDDATQSLETRVRAYLAVNCADCHQPGGNVTGALNLLPQASLAQTNLIDGNVATNTNGDPANRYLVPDDLTHSVVYQQMAAGNGFSRMPPLASNILDPDGLALLQAWIGNLSTNAPPSIFTQPANVTVLLGHGANFTVAAIGEQPLAFQWQKNGVSIPGATNTTLTLPNVGGAAAGNYAVMISDPAGNITSATATLTVLIPPSIAGPPENVTVLAGKKVILSVSATGTAPLQYQWYFNGKKIPGATRTTLTLGDVGKVNSGKYSVVVTGPGGTAGSTTVTLAVLQSAFPPTILTQPRSLTVKAGQTARFVVQSLGTPPMSYQWQKNNRVVANVGNVSGATTAKLQIVRVTFANAGSYRVVVTNPAGAVVSAPAKLVVK